jgi:transcriptional regulator with XRE-family HTH domain
MARKTNEHLQVKSGSVVSRDARNRLPAYIKLVPNRNAAPGSSLEFQGAEPRNDRAPLENRGGADSGRPRDIRGSLKVLQNFSLEHGPSVTTVQSRLQPRSNRALLTSVAMTTLETLTERLTDAMQSTTPPTSKSELARECGVSPAAVGKWLAGGNLNADNLAAAARALGVRDEWLRTGRLPRERDAHDAQVDRVIALLADMREPLAALTAAIDTLGKMQPATAKRRQRSS